MAQQLNEVLNSANMALLLGYAESMAPGVLIELKLARLRERVVNAGMHLEAALQLLREQDGGEPKEAVR